MSRTMESRDMEPSPDRLAHGRAAAAPFAWTQFALITITAVAIFIGFRLLPTGTNLSHMDFRVDPKAGNVIEFCDPRIQSIKKTIEEIFDIEIHNHSLYLYGNRKAPNSDANIN